MSGLKQGLSLKATNKNCSRQHLIFFYLYIYKKIRLDVQCESSARQRIHMKYQYQKHNEKVFMNVVCCSRDLGFIVKFPTGDVKCLVSILINIIIKDSLPLVSVWRQQVFLCQYHRHDRGVAVIAETCRQSS